MPGKPKVIAVLLAMYSTDNLADIESDGEKLSSSLKYGGLLK